MSTQDVKVKFTGDANNLKASTAQVRAEIDAVTKRVQAQKAAMDVARKSALENNSALVNFGKAGAGAAIGAAAVGAGAAVAAVAVAALAGAAVLAAKSVEKFGNIQDLSERTGLSPEFLQKISDAADQSGTSVDTLAKATTKFATALIGAKDGDDFSETIRDIGLSVDDLRGKAPEEILQSVASGLQGISDPMQRAAAAQKLFGKSGSELIPVMLNLSDILKSTGQLTADQVKKIDDIGDALSQLGNDSVAAAGAFVAEVSPAILDTVNALRHMVAALRAVGVGMEALNKGSSVEEAMKKADDFLEQKAKEIWADPEKKKPRQSVNIDPEAGGDGGGNGGGEKEPEPPKPKVDELPSERELREALEGGGEVNPTFNGQGAVRRPGELRRLKLNADRDRDRENRRQSRGIGGPSRLSQQGAMSAAEKLARESFGDRENQRPGMQAQTASERWEEMKAASDAKKQSMNDPSERAKRQAAAAAMADARNGQNAGDGKKPGPEDGKDTLAEDIKAMRKVIEERLPKKTT